MAVPENTPLPPVPPKEDPPHPPPGGKPPRSEGEKVVTDTMGDALTDEHGNPLPM